MTSPSPSSQARNEALKKRIPKKKKWNRGNWKHGMSSGKGRHPLYWVWATMVARCHRPADKSFPLYGGRGIHVCERWRVFHHFAKDMMVSYEYHARIHGRIHGERNTQLDRIDNLKGYFPDNVRWATKEEQARNKRPKKNTASKFKGVTRSGTSWQAEIRAGVVRKYLGVFKSQEEAARAYDKSARDLHGEFAYLNFPETA